jgi:PAS domain S-box-containing protein
VTAGADLAAVLDAIVDGVFAVDADGVVIAWNRPMEGLVGVSREVALGRPIAELIPWWPEHGAPSVRAVLAGGDAAIAAVPIAPPPGAAPARFEAVCTPLGAAGAGVTVMIRDVTTAFVIRQQLAESDTRFQIMADTSPVLLWMAGTDALCTFFNQRWLAFTGRTMADELGNGWAEGVHPEDFQRCMTIYMRAFVARRPFRMHYRLRRADGVYRWLLDTGVPRYLPSGQFAGYIGSCLDVTELKEVRDELDHRVRERTADLEAFARSVSHDLRAPLRTIDGFGRALFEDYGHVLDSQAHDYLERIRLGAVHMAGVIDGLLQLSKIGNTDLRFTACDLTRMAHDAAATLREIYPARPAEIRIDDGIVVPGDPRLLRIAMDNLIGNAWKFTSKRPDARIEVEAIKRDDSVICVVRDNGVGFDMTHAGGRLFGAFQRLHGQAEFPGTGLGLATVQKIASRHRGRIWAEAAPGKGAAFYLSLPLSPPPSAEDEESAAI